MGDSTEVPFFDFLEQADTGDIVLWSGTSLPSLAVEAATDSIYSHSTMVIKDPQSGEKYLFQSVSEAVGFDPLSTQDVTAHDGVQAGSLRDAMLWLFNRQDFPRWRRLTAFTGKGPGFDQKMWDLARGIDGTRFPVVTNDDGTMNDVETLAFIMLLYIQGRYENVQNLKPLFCSGAVAYMLQGGGILETTFPPNGYAPKDFSSQYSGPLKFANGVTYTDDTLISMPVV